MAPALGLLFSVICWLPTWWFGVAFFYDIAGCHFLKFVFVQPWNPSSNVFFGVARKIAQDGQSIFRNPLIKLRSRVLKQVSVRIQRTHGHPGRTHAQTHFTPLPDPPRFWRFCLDPPQNQREQANFTSSLLGVLPRPSTKAQRSVQLKDCVFEGNA